MRSTRPGTLSSRMPRTRNDLQCTTNFLWDNISRLYCLTPVNLAVFPAGLMDQYSSLSMLKYTQHQHLIEHTGRSYLLHLYQEVFIVHEAFPPASCSD